MTESVEKSMVHTPGDQSSGAEPTLRHTPGPWRIFQTKGKPPFYVIGIGRESGEGITDGNVGLGIWDGDSPEALANARLIAAAPELLAALKGTLFLFEGHAVTKTDIEQIAFARAAISKATGP